MDTMQWILDQLLGKLISGSLIEMLAKNFEDFAAARKNYHKTMDMLQEQLGEAAVPSVEEEKLALRQQTASQIFFSGILGIKANMDHFIDPVARSFLATDPETYLRERTAHQLPEYRDAQNIRREFYASLSPAQKEAYEDAISYSSYLETAGPKLAHYCGYLLGNKLLERIVPGYHPDLTQTIQYRTMLEEYFGAQLNWNIPSPSESLQGQIRDTVDQILSTLFSGK